MYFLYMVGVFFCCHNVLMDIDKLCKRVMSFEEIKDVPIIFVYKVIVCVFKAIESGECFYDTEFD